MASAKSNPKWNLGQSVVIVWERKPNRGTITKVGNKLITIAVENEHYTTQFDVTQNPPCERREIGSYGDLYTLEEYSRFERTQVAFKRIRRLMDEPRYRQRLPEEMVVALETLAKLCPEVD